MLLVLLTGRASSSAGFGVQALATGEGPLPLALLLNPQVIIYDICYQRAGHLI
jgi:hypothetical protein